MQIPGPCYPEPHSAGWGGAWQSAAGDPPWETPVVFPQKSQAANQLPAGDGGGGRVPCPPSPLLFSVRT